MYGVPVHAQQRSGSVVSGLLLGLHYLVRCAAPNYWQCLVIGTEMPIAFRALVDSALVFPRGSSSFSQSRTPRIAS